MCQSSPGPGVQSIQVGLPWSCLAAFPRCRSVHVRRGRAGRGDPQSPRRAGMAHDWRWGEEKGAGGGEVEREREAVSRCWTQARRGVRREQRPTEGFGPRRAHWQRPPETVVRRRGSYWGPHWWAADCGAQPKRSATTDSRREFFFCHMKPQNDQEKRNSIRTLLSGLDRPKIRDNSPDQSRAPDSRSPDSRSPYALALLSEPVVSVLMHQSGPISILPPPQPKSR